MDLLEQMVHKVTKELKDLMETLVLLVNQEIKVLTEIKEQ